MDFDLDLEQGAAVTRSSAGSTGDVSMPQLLASQTRNVELMSHLASYSELLVAVTGPQGAGKSALANALAAQRELPDDTVFVTASIMLGMPSVLSAIANHWDMPAIHEDSAQSREMIRNEALTRAEDGGGLLVIIDQAEQLDADTLNGIAHFALLAPQAISFALFGEQGFEAEFRNSPAQAPVHVLQLEPLTLDDAVLLIGQVYGEDGICPLSDQEVAKAIEISGGWPGALLLSAEKLIMAPGRAANTPRRASGFPLRNILGIAGIATLLAMFLLYQMSQEDEGEQQLADIAAEAAVAEALGQKPGLVKAGPQDFNYAEPVSEPAASAPETTELPVTEVATVSASAVEQEQAPAKPEEDAVPAAPVAKASVTEAKPDAAPAAPAVTPAPKTVSPVSVSRDEQVLLAAKGGYIVQLLGSHSEAGAAGFRKEWSDKVTGTLYQYQTTHNGKDWFVVVSGVYGSKAEARAAVNALPQKLRAQSPWIRPVTDAQKAIR